jgi:hypothetical protein
MNKVIEQGKLPIGVVLNGELHTDFELRPAMLDDTYKAAAAVPVPADVDANKGAMLAYRMALEDAIIFFQLVRLGSLSPIPAPAALAAEMDPDDMAVLRQAAEDAKKKQRASRSSLPTTGEASSSSCAPA